MSELDRAGEIFLAVRDLDPVAQDEAIARMCAGDAALTDLVRLLLRGDQAPLPAESLAEDIRAAHELKSTMVTSAPGHASDGGRPPSLAAMTINDRIGNYRVLERLGEGGFGVVYLAEQEKPVRRRVALKIIKLGMDTRQVVARFEAERQALALMDHPNIAKVFDAGTTETGRPYFVMELVKGLPITEYCDQRKLGIRQRLELVAQVCDALQHAHQRGVIHRDVKPSNVLVSTLDGDRPLPKVIDFGIAKATGASGRLTEKTIFTEFRQMIGTPEYMSPEQAGLSAEDVDIRADVYAAGVLLYELLTGQTPFDSKRLRSAAYGEIQRIIREEDPPKPSTRVGTRPETLDTAARQRSMPPTKLASAIQGELDWIVMKAIEKDRSRRYDSAGAMGADIQRYLMGHAVLAAPPARMYLIRKFVRRNRGPVVAASLLLAALVAGLTGTSLGLVRAARQEGIATRRAAELQDVAEFQGSIIDTLEPASTASHLMAEVLASHESALRAEWPPIGEEEIASRVGAFKSELKLLSATDTTRRFVDSAILAPSTRKLGELGASPGVEARVRRSLGYSYDRMGLRSESVEQFRRALAAMGEAPGAGGDDDHQMLTLRWEIAARIGDTAESFDLWRSAIDGFRGIHGSDAPETLALMHGCAMHLMGGEQRAFAVTLMEEVCQRFTRLHGPMDDRTLSAREGLASCRAAAGDAERAMAELLALADDVKTGVGTDDHRRMAALSTLARIELAQGRSTEALEHARLVFDTRLRLLGESDEQTLHSRRYLAWALCAVGRTTEATDMLDKAIETAQQSEATRSTVALTLLSEYASALERGEQLEKSLEALEFLARRLTEEYGADDPRVMEERVNAARVLLKVGRADKAKERLEHVLRAVQSRAAAALPVVVRATTALAEVEIATGAQDQAVARLDSLRSRLASSAGAVRIPPTAVANMLSALATAKMHDAKTPDDFRAIDQLLLDARARQAGTYTIRRDAVRRTLERLIENQVRWKAVESSPERDAAIERWRAELAAELATPRAPSP